VNIAERIGGDLLRGGGYIVLHTVVCILTDFGFRLRRLHGLTSMLKSSLPAFLAEDSSAIRNSLIQAMEDLARLKVVAFADTEDEAVDWLNTHPDEWRIAVLDVILGSGTGLGVLAKCRKHTKDHWVVLLTNHATTEIREAGKKLGADAVFDKATQLDEFLTFCSGVSVGPH
jgi:two-component system OmpR family response regulator